MTLIAIKVTLLFICKNKLVLLVSAEAIKARQAAFRREKTDISGISVERLAGHRNANQSPTGMIFGNRESERKSPLIPPKEKIDDDIMHRCIDELKSKR